MCYITCSLRFTSGVTPADLLAGSMVAKPSLPPTCKALVGLETGSYHAAAHSVRSGEPDTLPIGLFRLDFHKRSCDGPIGIINKLLSRIDILLCLLIDFNPNLLFHKIGILNVATGNLLIRRITQCFSTNMKGHKSIGAKTS